MYDQRVEKLSEIVEDIVLIESILEDSMNNPEKCEVCQLTKV